MVDMAPFRVEMFSDVTTGRFTDADTVDHPPGHSIGLLQGDRGSGRFLNGVLTAMGIRLNPTNAVTYRIELYSRYDGAWADHSFELRACNLFKSWDNSVTDVAACVDDVEYGWIGLDVPFQLSDPGSFFYNLEWSGAPGDTTGMIVLGGMREV